MLFNTLTCLVFLAVVLTVYHLLRTRAQNAFLLVASYVFYGWWDYRFCSLLLISTVVDYFCARGIERGDDQRVPFAVDGRLPGAHEPAAALGRGIENWGKNSR